MLVSWEWRIYSVEEVREKSSASLKSNNVHNSSQIKDLSTDVSKACLSGRTKSHLILTNRQHSEDSKMCARKALLVGKTDTSQNCSLCSQREIQTRLGEI